jgi:uncharacterized protein DUF6599
MLKKNRIIICIVVLAIFYTMFLISGCGDGDKGTTAGPEKYLIESPSKVNLQRIGEIRTFEGKSLWEYINGGAELYYLYDFITVATADYKHDNTEIVVDIYQFGTPDKAYGIYSMFRSPDVDLIRLGVEGFIDPVSLTFIKDVYMVKLVGYDESMEMSLALTNLAEEIASLIPGVIQPPNAFNNFPDSAMIPATDKLYAESYLGQKFLTDMYTRDYILDNDTVSLFFGDDEMGGKYLEWSKIAEKTNKKEPAPDDMPFDSEYGFIYNDSFYGPILIGLKNGKMFGLVGYKDNHFDFFRQWLLGFGKK